MITLSDSIKMITLTDCIPGDLIVWRKTMLFLGSKYEWDPRFSKNVVYVHMLNLEGRFVMIPLFVDAATHTNVTLISRCTTKI